MKLQRVRIYRKMSNNNNNNNNNNKLKPRVNGPLDGAKDRTKIMKAGPKMMPMMYILTTFDPVVWVGLSYI